MSKTLSNTLLLVVMLTSHFCFAQMKSNSLAKNSFLSNDILDPVMDYYIQKPDYKFHASLKPYNHTSLYTLEDLGIPYKHMKIQNHFFSKSVCDTPKFKNTLNLQFLPQVNIEQGYDMLRNKMTNETSGGLYFKTEVNNNFAVACQFIGGSVSMPNFVDTVTRAYGVIPGMGIAYRTTHDSLQKEMERYSFNNLSGYLSFSPKNFINIQVGKDKHFIGDGYRSVLLSDVATNYPFFKTTFNFWHIQYSSWASWFYDVSNSNGFKKNFQNKFGTFHYLSWNACKNLNISLFENIIWQGSDSLRHRSFDVNYLNPVIFYRPVEYSLGSSDNAMLGLNASWIIAKRIKFYGQIGLDEFYLKEIRAGKGWWANKQAYQAGFRYVDAFGIKKLSLQMELNTVRPYTYSHGSPSQSYTHFNQPLAHPFGANFKEVVAVATYKHYRYRLSAKLIAAEIGMDTLGSTANMGQNIFLSYTTRPYEYGHYTTQGNKAQFMQAEIKYTYYLLADLNLRIEAGLVQRVYKRIEGYDRETPFLYLGIRTNLYNNYRDY